MKISKTMYFVQKYIFLVAKNVLPNTTNEIQSLKKILYKNERKFISICRSLYLLSLLSKRKNIHEYLLHPVSSYLRKNHRCAECYQDNSIKSIKKCCACNNLKLTSEFPSLRCYRCKDCKQCVKVLDYADSDFHNEKFKKFGIRYSTRKCVMDEYYGF